MNKCQKCDGKGKYPIPDGGEDFEIVRCECVGEGTIMDKLEVIERQAQELKRLLEI